MRHTLVKLTGLLLVLTLVLTGCNLIGIDPMMQLDEDFAALEKDFSTVVADYDGGTITKGEALGTFASMYSYYQQMYSMFGMNITQDVVENIKQQTLEHEVQSVAVKKELEARGLSLSVEKLQEASDHAQETYKQVHDSFYASAEGKGDVKERQTEYNMYANGISADGLYAQELAEAEEALLEENIKAEISELTDEELQTAYDEKVAEDEEQYGSDAGAFESAMSSDEDIVAWMPEGYRTVKHILVKPEDDVLSAFTTARTDLENAQSDLDGYEDELEALNDDDQADADEEAADAGDDAAEEDEEPEATEAPRTAEAIQADIDAATAKVDAAKQALEDAEAAVLESVKDKTDEIYAKIEAGEDFAELIKTYGEDPGMQNEPTATRGYYVSADSANWDKGFTAGAMALEKVGDVSEVPAVSSSGVHIIRYESDVTPGAVPLEEIHDKLYDTTLESRQEEHATETMESLVAALNPVYHVDAFNIG